MAVPCSKSWSGGFDARRALDMMAGSPHGCTEGVLRGHGFGKADQTSSSHPLRRAGLISCCEPAQKIAWTMNPKNWFRVYGAICFKKVDLFNLGGINGI
jgi:hypothetical protein